MDEKEKAELTQAIAAGHPFIIVVTEDERPVVEALKELRQRPEHAPYLLRTWDADQGLYDEGQGVEVVYKKAEAGMPDVLYDAKMTLANLKHKKEHMLMVMHDLHHQLDRKSDADRQLIRRIKNVLSAIAPPHAPSRSRLIQAEGGYQKHLIATMPVLNVPKELEALAYVIEFGLPQKKDMRRILDGVLMQSGKQLDEKERERTAEAALGLTESEAYYAMKKILVAQGTVRPAAVAQEKKQLIRKHRLLDYHETDVTLGDIGGMKQLVEWVKKRKPAFEETFRAAHQLNVPKGLLLTGIQGCGKSHAVKAIASELELPLLRLDMGRMMSKWVGESDQNLKKALHMVEAMSPCVLWMDEIEKNLPSDGQQAHETTMRLLGSLLTWMQEKTCTAFVVATANQIQALPAELLRKGRFDDIFFIDLPTEEEREEILQVHMKKKGLAAERVKTAVIAQETEGFSGAELEVLLNEAMLEAAVRQEELCTWHLQEEAKRTSPLSRTMKPQIEALRRWADQNGVRTSGASGRIVQTRRIQLGGHSAPWVP